jgi:hypothetical protein
MAADSFCRGSDCECEEYDPPEPGAPSKCLECGHGKSKHPKAEALAVPSKGKAGVLALFSSQAAEKRIEDILPLSARLADFGDARKETLKGFRDPSHTATKKKSKGKQVQVCSIIILQSLMSYVP